MKTSFIQARDFTHTVAFGMSEPHFSWEKSQQVSANRVHHFMARRCSFMMVRFGSLKLVKIGIVEKQETRTKKQNGNMEI